jgi:hypothetical protein
MSGSETGVRRKEMDEKKDRKHYEKPAVVFEKRLEAMAADCDPTGDTGYTAGVPGYCKAEGACMTLFS